MCKKKNLMINCDLCDARNVSEESLSHYEQITLNADILIVNEQSKNILHRLPVTYNVDETVELEGEFHLVTINGKYEINSQTSIEENTFLSVNGLLEIKPGSQQALENIIKMSVNGQIKYPESLSSIAGKLSVNGSVVCIPDDCIELKSCYIMDKYFPLRARENGKYYAANKVIIFDETIDFQKLLNKHVQFKTKKLIIPETLVESVITMFDETVDIQILPPATAYVGDDCELTKNLIHKYGSRLYIDGDLYLTADSMDCLDHIESMTVVGEVSLKQEQVQAFKKVCTSYGSMVIVKDIQLKNKINVTIDNALLSSAPNGISVVNCASVRFDDDVDSKSILEKVELINCAKITCTPKQRSAIEVIGQNIALIADGSADTDSDSESLNTLKKLPDTKVINADRYVL